MSRTIWLRPLIISVSVFLAGTPAHAEKPVFKLVETVSATDLNRILDAERGEFIASAECAGGYQLPPVSTATKCRGNLYSPA